MRIPVLILTIAGSAALSGCAYGYGSYGGGYGPYSGLSVGVGVGSGFGYGDYYGGYPYGGYYSDPYWGWYDGFYYPGTGYYVYDSYRRPHVWNDRQRRHWGDRRDRWARRGGSDDHHRWRNNWRDFSHRDRDRDRDHHRDNDRDHHRGNDRGDHHRGH